MAVVTTHALIDYSLRNKKDPEYLAPDIDVIGKQGDDREHYVHSNLFDATLTDNLPIALEPADDVGTSKKQVSFLDDYYYRVHIIPSELNLGNLLSAQTREVEVWSAYFTDQLLSSISEEGGEGITLIEPEATPTTFDPLESRIYVFNISTNGPPSINASFVFNFALEDPELIVIGRRVVVWPFVPQTEHKEEMEWKTDIISSFRGEQRLALREAPRQSFSYDFLLNEYQFSKAKAITTQWAHRVYGIPVWSESTFVGAVASGTSSILLDTTNSDYRENDIVILWESDTKFEAIQTLDIPADRVNLKLATENTYSNAYIIPLRFARTLQGMSYRRSSTNYIETTGTFLVTDNKDIAAGIGYDVYLGEDVIPQQTIILGSLSEKISRAVDLFDNGSGPIEVDIRNAWVNSILSITFDTLTREERWEARKWIHSRRGKQKSFWLPSWNPDLTVLEDVGTASSSITCLPIGYALYYSLKDIMFQLNNGDRYYNRILSASTDIDGNEVLSLSSNLGFDLVVAEVDFICFMSHVRFNSDNISISHGNAGRASLIIPVIETPE